jgi:hypothetical protein
MGVGLLGDKLLLKLRQQPLCFGQRQAQVGDVAKTIGPADRHHLGPPGLAVNPHPNQMHRPFHPRVPSRQHTRLVIFLSS